MIKAVIFDWGGVLIKNPTRKIVSYCSDYFGISSSEFSKVYARFAIPLQKAEISETDLWDAVIKEFKLQKPNPKFLWRKAFEYAYKPKKAMFSLAAELKNEYLTGFLSNTEVAAMEFFLKNNYDMFHVAVFSCAEGCVKPEKKIYDITLEKLGVGKYESVLIDDSLRNIQGAEEAGIVGLLFKNTHQVKKDLSALLNHRYY